MLQEHCGKCGVSRRVFVDGMQSSELTGGTLIATGSYFTNVLQDGTAYTLYLCEACVVAIFEASKEYKEESYILEGVPSCLGGVSSLDSSKKEFG